MSIDELTRRLKVEGGASPLLLDAIEELHRQSASIDSLKAFLLSMTGILETASRWLHVAYDVPSQSADTKEMFQLVESAIALGKERLGLLPPANDALM